MTKMKLASLLLALALLAPCLLAASPVAAEETVHDTWYLAEGSTKWGFETSIAIMNPNDEVVVAFVEYSTPSRQFSPVRIDLPALSQTTVNPEDRIGADDFSTKVVAARGTGGFRKEICVDRRMVWKDGTGQYSEGHSSVGVTDPATTWYLPEGSSKWGFETWILVQNPSTYQAECTFTYMTEEDGPVVVEHSVKGKSRETFSMVEDIGQKDASVKIESGRAVIPERSMYRNNRREGHDSIGTTAPANDYYLAEGATGYPPGFITYALVQNPHDTPTDVALTYMTKTGPVAGPAFQMPPGTRRTIRLNDQLGPDVDVSTHVHGSQPIIAERAMYWNNGTGEACHDSIGMAAPYMTFYLPDGASSASVETWTLVQNPNGTDVKVTISYLRPNGKGNVTKTAVVPANSRRTFNMAAHSGIAGAASIMVKSAPGGRPVMVERAMYWDNRGAGTNTIGGYSD